MKAVHVPRRALLAAPSLFLAGTGLAAAAPQGPEERLAALGLALPPAPKSIGAYTLFTRHGALVFVAGQIPFENGRLAITGRVPDQVTIEQARASARIAALNVLAVLNSAAKGRLSRVRQILRVEVFVQAAEGFAAHPEIANAASDLFLDVFGEAGRHARAAIGAASLPLNAPVEITAIAALAR